MEPVTAVAATVAIMLAGKAGEGFGQEAGKAAWEGVFDALARIRRRSIEDANARSALVAAERAPDSEEAIGRLAGYLEALAESDRALHADLRVVATELESAPVEFAHIAQYAKKIVNTSFYKEVNVQRDFRIGG
jgi:hypothetical protein